MNFIASLFSSGASKLVDSVGKSLDSLITSDEERLKVKAIIQKEMNRLEKSHLEAVADYDKEISLRHANDMKSDSWLSKNIRPLVLAFMSVSAVLLAYLTIFILDASSTPLIEPWIDLLKVLLVTIYAFYFGSRGLEKVQKIKNK